MATILSVARRLFPNGTLPIGDRSVDRCPDWPPDVFALAATLTELSGLYAEPWCTAAWDGKGYAFGATWSRTVKDLAREWAQTGEAPLRVRALWKTLLSTHGRKIVATRGQYNYSALPWQSAAIQLLAIADEASAGVGFIVPDGSDAGKSFIAILVANSLVAEDRSEPHPELPYIPTSLCRMIPPTECCVQPKTSTPVVGCTLRSLSHHVALLPSVGVVETDWMIGHPDVDGLHRPLNLLIVPFPYVIQGQCFQAFENPSDSTNGFFSLDPLWLYRGSSEESAKAMAEFLIGLIDVAEREVDHVHGIVLPELALSDEIDEAVANIISKKKRKMEIFISGSITKRTAKDYPANSTYFARFDNGEILRWFRQMKHHRWRLDRSQIRRYHLGHVLDPNRVWWEQIDVGGRLCSFNVVRPGASLAVLVCEDLARFDPVMPAINAIAPSLLIALLMDGPQLERRWPGRYATVLADDPGSSVLTLTSLGMIRRSTESGESECRKIALWKEPGEAARELALAPGDHALLLSLTGSVETQTTLDMRSDDGGTQRLRLHAARGVRCPPTTDGSGRGWPDFG